MEPGTLSSWGTRHWCERRTGLRTMPRFLAQETKREDLPSPQWGQLWIEWVWEKISGIQVWACWIWVSLMASDLNNVDIVQHCWILESLCWERGLVLICLSVAYPDLSKCMINVVTYLLLEAPQQAKTTSSQLHCHDQIAFSGGVVTFRPAPQKPF